MELGAHENTASTTQGKLTSKLKEKVSTQYLNGLEVINFHLSQNSLTDWKKTWRGEKTDDPHLPLSAFMDPKRKLQVLYVPENLENSLKTHDLVDSGTKLTQENRYQWNQWN